jgi:hypothetical protein
MNYYQQPMPAFAPAPMPPGGVTNHPGLYTNGPERQFYWGGGGYPEAAAAAASASQNLVPVPDGQSYADPLEDNTTPTQLDQQFYYQQPGGYGGYGSQ